MALEGEETMANPFLGEAGHEKVGAELTTKRGGWWRSVSVEKNGERGRSSGEGWRRCKLLRVSGGSFYKVRGGAQAVGKGGGMPELWWQRKW
jgi:hypothetical protein